MALPLVLLAVGSVGAGYVGVPHALGGSNAIETFLQNRVFLDLRVAVKEQWREDERLLDQMGMKPPEK